MFEDLDRGSREGPRPKSPCITTMTFSVMLDECALIDRHNIDTLRSCNKYFDTIEPSKFSPKAITMTKSSMNMNIKVFPRGSVHITGCRHLHDLRNLIDALGVLLQAAYDMPRTPKGISASLNMINVGTAWPHTIRLSEFAGACWAAGGYAEQPEKPPSCIVRHDATALAYKSGKMIVTGKTPAAIASTFAFVSGVLRKL